MRLAVSPRFFRTLFSSRAPITQEAGFTKAMRVALDLIRQMRVNPGKLTDSEMAVALGGLTSEQQASALVTPFGEDGKNWFHVACETKQPPYVVEYMSKLTGYRGLRLLDAEGRLPLELAVDPALRKSLAHATTSNVFPLGIRNTPALHETMAGTSPQQDVERVILFAMIQARESLLSHDLPKIPDSEGLTVRTAVALRDISDHLNIAVFRTPYGSEFYYVLGVSVNGEEEKGWRVDPTRGAIVPDAGAKNAVIIAPRKTDWSENPFYVQSEKKHHPLYPVSWRTVEIADTRFQPRTYVAPSVGL